jgi:hypothetical protein
LTEEKTGSVPISSDSDTDPKTNISTWKFFNNCFILYGTGIQKPVLIGKHVAVIPLTSNSFSLFLKNQQTTILILNASSTGS